jgi:hypothetical protein
MVVVPLSVTSERGEPVLSSVLARGTVPVAPGPPGRFDIVSDTIVTP